MATVNNSIPHTERTSTEPRENRIEPVILSKIDQVNENIRLLRLTPVDPNHTIKFFPGQWLDTFIPNLSQAGGFTLTSTPSDAQPPSSHLELAVQKSTNPPAQWFWKPSDQILQSQLAVRVGGSFAWPPPGVEVGGVERLVLVAGGVGVNPLVSIATHLLSRTPAHSRPKEVHVLYTTRLPGSGSVSEVLFYERLVGLVRRAAEESPGTEGAGKANVSLRLFLTKGCSGWAEEGEGGLRQPVRTVARRIGEGDLVEALDGNGGGGAEGRKGTVAYVCGPPGMTDEFVGVLRRQEGMSEERVLCEKWW